MENATGSATQSPHLQPLPGGRTGLAAARHTGNEGARWLLRAAESGLAGAQFDYGRLLLRKNIGALVPSLSFSPKRAVFWLSKAAEQGQAAAAYELARIYRDPAFSQQSAATSTQWTARAARLGHPRAQYEYGAHLWRRRVSLGEDADISAANWLVKAKRQGVAEAARLLEKITEPAPPAAPRTVRARRQALVLAAQVSPLLAMRLELAGSLGLRKGEALYFDPAGALDEHILLVDLRRHIGKTRRRLFEISDETQTALLRRMQSAFSAPLAGSDDVSGDQRRRHAQIDAFCRKIGIDSALFFSDRPESLPSVDQPLPAVAADPAEPARIRLAA